MMDQTIIVTDVETGGLDFEKHSLLTVSMIATRGLQVIETKEWVIKHREYNVTAKALMINGIDIVEHDNGATKAHEVASEICQFIERVRKDDEEKVMFFGQNTAFDMAFILKLMVDCFALGTFNTLVSHRRLDLMNFTAFLNLTGHIKTESLSLDHVIEALDIHVPERHTASGDAWATWHALKVMIRMVGHPKVDA